MLQALLFFLKGAAVGAAIALPAGPVGMFCIQRSMSSGAAVGLTCGLGAALADAFYGAVAAFGLRFVSAFLTGHEPYLKAAGGLLLLFLAWRMFRETAEAPRLEARGGRMAGDMASTFLITMTNPMTILAFAVVFAGLGLADNADFRLAAALVLGVFAGSCAWWFSIAFGGAFLRRRLTRHLPRIRKTAALVIGGFGLAALVSLAVSGI